MPARQNYMQYLVVGDLALSTAESGAGIRLAFMHEEAIQMSLPLRSPFKPVAGDLGPLVHIGIMRHHLVFDSRDSHRPSGPDFHSHMFQD